MHHCFMQMMILSFGLLFHWEKYEDKGLFSPIKIVTTHCSFGAMWVMIILIGLNQNSPLPLDCESDTLLLGGSREWYR